MAIQSRNQVVNTGKTEPEQTVHMQGWQLSLDNLQPALHTQALQPDNSNGLCKP